MNKFDRALLAFSFNRSRRVEFYEQLKLMIENNFNIIQALEHLQRNAIDSGGKLKKVNARIYDDIRKKMSRSESFSQALKGWVPIQEQMLIYSGDQHGRLPEAIDNIIELSGGATKIAASFAMLAYPVLIMAGLAGFMSYFRFEVAPQIEDLYPTEQWTGISGAFYATSVAISNYAIPVGFALLISALLIVYSLPRLTGTPRQILDRLPPWSLYKTTVGVSFLLSVSSLIKSDLSPKDSINQIQQHSSPYLKEKTKAIIRQIDRGNTNLGNALRQTKMDFPDRQIINLVSIYADLRGFEFILEKLCTRWLDKTAARIVFKNRLLMFLGLFLMATTLAWMALSINDLMSQIKQAARSSM